MCCRRKRGNVPPQPDVELFILRKCEIAVRRMLDLRRLPTDTLEIELAAHQMAGLMVADLRLFLAGDTEKAESIKVIAYPATWWDHFKTRWLPRWALLRWPAKQKEHRVTCLTTITRICPHLMVPADRRPDVHYRFCKGLENVE